MYKESDANPGVLCRPLCNRFEHADLKDTEKIVGLARRLSAEEGLDAVFTAGTDFSYAVSCAAEACGLAAHSPAAAKNASDKPLMRSCFKKACVSSPRFIEIGGQYGVSEDAAADDKTLYSFLHTLSADADGHTGQLRPGDPLDHRDSTHGRVHPFCRT